MDRSPNAIAHYRAQDNTSSSSTVAIQPVGVTTTPEITAVVGTTTFHDTSQTTTSRYPSIISRRGDSIYPVDTPRQLLNKAFLVDQFYWTPGMTTRAYPIPTILSSVDTVVKLFSKFRYFRAKVKLEFRMTSSVYHQGALMLGWLPCVSTAMAHPDLFTLSGCNAHTMSASTKDNLSIELPYWCPMEWVDNLGGALTPDGRICTVWLSELNRLLTTSPSISASIPMVVYASFTEIEMMGATSTSKDPGVIKELQNKNQNGINAKTVVSGISQVVRALPVIGPIWGAVATIINTFAGDLAKPVNDAVAQPVVSSASSDYALCHGITYADEVSMYSQALISQSMRFNGMLTSHMTLNELARKPMLHAQFKFDGTITAYALECSPQRSNYGDFRNIDWLWAVSLAFRYWKGAIKYSIHFVLPSFMSFKCQITQQDQLLLPITSTGDLMNKIIDVAGETWVDVEVPFLRPTIWVDPYLEGQAVFGACPQVNIVQLTAIVGSSLPATPVCYINVYRAGGEDTAFRGLQNAAHGLGDIEAESTSLELRFTKPFPAMCESANQSIEKGYIANEIAATVSDCLKRASLTITGLAIGANDYSAPFNFPAGAGNINYSLIGLEPYQYFSSMFLFWRGSRIIRHSQATDFWGVKGATTTLNWGDGAAFYFPLGTAGVTNREGLCVNYTSIYPYIPVGQPAVTVDLYNYGPASQGPSVDLPLAKQVIGTNLSTASGIVVSAGDDFMLIHPVPFFPSKFYPTVSRQREFRPPTKSETTVRTKVTSTTL